ncbi:hypothetical protein [Shewanella psychrophila]|nr:hypothetical protein [Shewanella psychrophila]
MNITTVGVQSVSVSLDDGKNIESKSEKAQPKSELAFSNVSGDSVTLSSEAIELSKAEVTVMGNGNGNEPPKVNQSIGVSSYGNGNGNEPPKVEALSITEAGMNLRGNGSGNEPLM